MEGLINWVRQIVFFMIFMSVFYQFVPDKKYKSYLKLFASLVLILLTMNPLAEMFDFRQQLDFNQDVFAYPREVEEFRLKAEQVQGQQYEDVLKNYRQTVEEQLERMAERFGMYISSCDIELSGEAERLGEVMMVRLTVSYRRTDGSLEEAGRTGMEKDTGQIVMEEKMGQTESKETAGGTKTVEEVKNIEEIETVRIPPVQAEAAVSETASLQSETGENRDTLNLKEQILQLYQLKPEQVAVNLE